MWILLKVSLITFLSTSPCKLFITIFPFFHPEIELFRRVRVTVPARSYISTAFLVTVVRNGEAPVIVEATGNGVSASLFRTIDVKVFRTT